MGFIKAKNTGTVFTAHKVYLVFLVILFCTGSFVLMKTVNNASRGQKRLELYYKGAERFNEESKALYLKGIAGFWAFDIEIMSAGRPMRKKDRLEIKENGIIWQVIEWETIMPGNTQETFTHIRTAYVNPYGVSRGDTLSDAYVISQAFICGSDTCFGGYNYTELWNVARNGEDLSIAKRNYRLYKGDIAAFFPRGSVTLVEKSSGQLYYDTIVDGVKETKLNTIHFIRKTDSNTGKVTLLTIRDTITDLHVYFKVKLENDFLGTVRIKADEEEIIERIEMYYQHFIVNEQWRQFPRPIPRTVWVSFVVGNNGAVDSVRFQPLEGYSRMFSVELERQIKTWRFPPPRSSVRVTHTLSLP